MPLSDEELERYRETLRQRDREAREWQEKAHRRARQDARHAAALLKSEFGASRVFLFGSVAQEEHLSPHSDIDLAVEGLPPENYYEAVARVQSVTSGPSVDLVRLDRCSDSLRRKIKDTGIEL